MDRKKILGLHTGDIKIKNGFLIFEDMNLKAGEIQIDMTSLTITDIIDTQIYQEFKNHLFSVDFFDIPNYPLASLFIKRSSFDGYNYSITADLSIKEIVKTINFDASIELMNEYLFTIGKLSID